ncbi:hypothetical protein VOLCADRAFT_108324 [Volvox carteri f. nagariensis]|uniref:Sister chromatid cohesion protein DCC1 n=1 Tax=Volvox carteri f. nagariensis TaxID=3068 RepID=D8UJG8_VOLCA|nr:uncharacterized protein VOLCADRAFT_108324 [Volvox carteri f. nagariensis]EFJ40141.1 hypothetical protein VOLCADRAFT_108324 [Volvox carteri f. nagariensis]|eukprot:XP_002958798.1 hypothetical protein VOLCADRAFT_108324 [Volvox carteri f. nagariensis]
MSTLGLKPGQPRAIAYAADGVRSDLRLLEVDEKLLQEIMEKGVVIKGGEEEEAVLVTSCRTYSMKLVETTNLQLLVGPEEEEEEEFFPPPQFRSAARLGGPVAVNATSTSHIELVEVAPRLDPIRDLIWAHPYGVEDEQPAEGAGAETDTEMAAAGIADLDTYIEGGRRSTGAAGAAAGRGGGGGGGGGGVKGGYTFGELLERIQASPEELRNALAAEGALQLAGRWRAVDPNYLGSLLELVLLTAQQEGMPVGCLREDVLVESLRQDGYHPDVVRHCLSVYGKSAVGAESDGGPGGARGNPRVWCLDETKVCVHFASRVMGGRTMLLNDFIEAWKRAVPYGLTPSLDMLRSEALIDVYGNPANPPVEWGHAQTRTDTQTHTYEEGSGADARISPFPASSLPREPGERFAALFRVRPRWEWTHMEPYLEGMQEWCVKTIAAVVEVLVPGQSVEALLMRFARASQPTPDAPLMYSAR